jgi:hypothetical protein
MQPDVVIFSVYEYFVNYCIFFTNLLGTTPGGNDVYAFDNVGVVQHKALHQLYLQTGYQYYATVRGKYHTNSIYKQSTSIMLYRGEIVFCTFVLFLLAIVLFVLLQYTNSDYLPLVSSNSSY